MPFLADAVVPFANALSFVVVQSFFFWYIGAAEVLHVVEGKGRVAAQARQAAATAGDHRIVRLLDSAVLDAEKANLTFDPTVEERYRVARNREKLRVWVGPWFVAIGAAMLVFLRIHAEMVFDLVGIGGLLHFCRTRPWSVRNAEAGPTGVFFRTRGCVKMVGLCSGVRGLGGAPRSPPRLRPIAHLVFSPISAVSQRKLSIA